MELSDPISIPASEAEEIITFINGISAADKCIEINKLQHDKAELLRTMAPMEEYIKKAPPGDPGLVHFNNAYQDLLGKLKSLEGPYTFEKLYDAYADLHKKYGPIVRLNLGVKMLLLFDPEDIQTILNLGEKYPHRPLLEALRHYRLKRKDLYSCAGLVSENGEQWHRLRQAVNFMMVPSFSKSYFLTQEKVANDFISRMYRLRNASGMIPDFLQELYRFTEEAIGVVCFGKRLGLLDDSKENAEFSAKLTKAVDDSLKAHIDALVGFPWWKYFNTSTYKKLVRAQDFIQSFAAECIKEAELKLKDPGYNDDVKLNFFKQLFNNENMTSSDISLLMTEIFSAGIDATGNVIGFLIYNLAKNPDIQEKLYQNILEHSTGGFNPDSISKMKYLMACIQESQRLTPTTGGSARILTTPAILSGYQVPAKTFCFGLQPTISLLEKYFEDPLDYKPERWLDESGTSLVNRSHPYCVAPFSHGVRRCVGQRFAEQEIRLCVAKIIQKFRVEYDGPDVGSALRLSLIPDKPLNMRFIER